MMKIRLRVHPSTEKDSRCKKYYEFYGLKGLNDLKPVKWWSDQGFGCEFSLRRLWTNPACLGENLAFKYKLEVVLKPTSSPSPLVFGWVTEEIEGIPCDKSVPARWL